METKTKQKKLKSLKKTDNEEKVVLDDFIKEAQLIQYKDDIKKYYKSSKEGFISKEESLQIIKKYSSSKKEEIVEILSESDNDSAIELQQKKSLKGKVIDFANNLFNYANRNFAFIKIDDEIYFKAKDIAEFLDYADTNDAIKKHVRDKYKFTLENLEKIRPGVLPGLTWNEKNTIYMSEPGIYNLIMKSKKPEAEAFQDFLLEKLLPTLRKTGSYNLTIKVNFDTSFFESVYDMINNPLIYDKVKVVYIAVIGIFESGFLCKFGISRRVFSRDFDEHQKTFGEQFKMIFIAETDNNEIVEENFKKAIVLKKLNRKLEFDGKMRTELFVTTTNFTPNDAKNLMMSLIEQYPLESNRIKDEKIKELENKFDNDKEIIIANTETEKERLRLEQEKERTRQIEMIEITKRIETDKKLEMEKERTRQIELQIILAEKQQNKQILEITKEEKKEEKKDKQKDDIYWQYLNKNTEKNQEGHIFCTTLYENFKLWYRKKYNNTIPSNKEFITNLKRHKETIKVKVGGETRLGIKHLKIIS
jgi:prophage antirepressor-like protein